MEGRYMAKWHKVALAVTLAIALFLFIRSLVVGEWEMNLFRALFALAFGYYFYCRFTGQRATIGVASIEPDASVRFQVFADSAACVALCLIVS
jgi:hypothetical protein